MEDTFDTLINGSRVGVIGGSIAGCATAIALSRLGCHVTILERSSTGLADRGSGIAVPPPLRDELVEHGYLPSDYRCWKGVGRRWYVADETNEGSLQWRQPGAVVTNNWGTLWRGLRANVPGEVDYVDGAMVADVAEGDDGVTLRCADGSERVFDVVIGADGYKSAVRQHLHPESRPRFSGYILWRGNFPAEQLRDHAAWDEVLELGEWITVGFDGGHGVMYPIPDFDNTQKGALRVNWAIYAPMPDELELDGPSSIPPGAVEDGVYAAYRSLLAEVMPPKFAPVFDSPQDQVSIQPVYDELVDSYTRGRLALIGDAATLPRPHTGSGATKAIQDALLLETLGAEHDRWPALLRAYDEDRSATGRAMVELGRRIGRDQVEQTPPWATMTPSDFESWTTETLSGESLYFWGNEDEPVAEASQAG